MGLRNDVVVMFGKHLGATVAETPSSYIRWCLEQDWFETKYPDLIDPFEEELKWRDDFDGHFEDRRDMRY